MDPNDSRTWRLPTDDAWRKCTLRGIIEDGARIWLDCSGCQRSSYVEALPWIQQYGVDIDMPLLLLARRIRCTRCGRRTVAVKSEPYRNLPRVKKPKPNGEIAFCPACDSGRVQGSHPLRRPYNPLTAAREFMRNRIMIECECLDCGNWWTQPEGPHRATARTVSSLA
ncbi:hypothetical protein [Hyphomicrobium sp. ghe19]|uniref:hypothetical protein n=1 Tax=Hyphomicrobium sp. ghe19 TaxID=2682968 RepID=UPI0013669168|nr:hypothetical protein HYPP_03799 [Hyphomicrobium sp. ghe19]